MDAETPAQMEWSFLSLWSGEETQKANWKCFVTLKVCPIPPSECFLRFGVCVGLLATVVWLHWWLCFVQEKNLYGDFDLSHKFIWNRTVNWLYWISDYPKIKTGWPQILFGAGGGERGQCRELHCMWNLKTCCIFLTKGAHIVIKHLKGVLDQRGVKTIDLKGKKLIVVLKLWRQECGRLRKWLDIWKFGVLSGSAPAWQCDSLIWSVHFLSVKRCMISKAAHLQV